jgi:hypothetical protein
VSFPALTAIHPGQAVTPVSRAVRPRKVITGQATL